LMFVPHPAYDSVISGVKFTIREGGKVVGHGSVISRSKELPPNPTTTAP
jgi:hypothetical protein